MLERADVNYLYDGSFMGFLCCVYNYYYNPLKPVDIISQDNFTPSFYGFIEIETIEQEANKVRGAIENKISLESLEFLQDCFLSRLKGREMYMLRYIEKGFKIGGKIRQMLTDDTVDVLQKAWVHLLREQRLYLGIVRFYKAGDVYIASIKPENQILPLLAHHFSERFANESFMIYDESNHQALIYSNNQWKIIYVKDIQLPPVELSELETQRLWKQFYDTIAIKDRANPRCRMNFLPKRTWDRLPE
ncbi:MAG: TIGR03915 family putative DNA repair protein, partial [Oscillospiraceae bacterium]